MKIRVFPVAKLAEVVAASTTTRAGGRAPGTSRRHLRVAGGAALVKTAVVSPEVVR
jgi:hypothetical protein